MVQLADRIKEADKDVSNVMTFTVVS